MSTGPAWRAGSALQRAERAGSLGEPAFRLVILVHDRLRTPTPTPYYLRYI